MPEAYTHLRCAQGAVRLSHLRPEDPIAFGAGSNGPDMLFCYRCWRSAGKRGQDLPTLGGRMHREKTGAFLLSLLRHAQTPAQRSYVLGFLCHYGTDTIVHPYVAVVSGPGGTYDRPGGHGYFEIALDSFLHEQDTGDRAVPARDCCPRLVGAALAQVALLLHTCLLEVYGEDVTLEALADAFHHTWYMRRMFVSRLKIKRGFFWLVEPSFGGRGRITGHMTPARLEGLRESDPVPLPAVWQHAVTGETVQGDIFELLERAEANSAACMQVGADFWQGRIPLEEAAARLGSLSYESGVEDAASRGEEPAPDGEQKELLYAE